MTGGAVSKAESDDSVVVVVVVGVVEVGGVQGFEVRLEDRSLFLSLADSSSLLLCFRFSLS